jgi:hypothetical protein
MRKLLLACLAFVSVAINAQAQQRVGPNDFKPAAGSFSGTLTYLDYSSGKPFTMPANVLVRLNGNMIILSYRYPKEPKADGNDTLSISADGRSINNAATVERTVEEDGTIKMVTEQEAPDGNEHKMAKIRHFYYAGKNTLQLRKEVRFAGTDKWILRNEYIFSR